MNSEEQLDEGTYPAACLPFENKPQCLQKHFTVNAVCSARSHLTEGQAARANVLSTGQKTESTEHTPI